MDMPNPETNAQPVALGFSALEKAICLRLKSVMHVNAMQIHALPFRIQAHTLCEQIK
jgi:hypothetical protein